MTENSEPIFEAIGAENPVTEVESVCMNCYKNGMTRLMLTKIPFYRDVVISSFTCDHCGYKNSEVQSANVIKDKGININVLVKDQKDLNREVIKSDFASLEIPEIEFEIPPKTQKAYLTTIEGLLTRIYDGIKSDLEQNNYDADVAEKLNNFLEKLDDLKTLKTPFHVKINDASGDSFIQNPNAPHTDTNAHITYYKRTKSQNEMLDINTEDIQSEEEKEQDEIINFKDNCPNCGQPCDTHMKPTNIPYFKNVIVMCTTCDNCGHRSNEVKSGTGISEKGVKFVLKLTDPTDVSRDILKSEAASFEIPDLDFVMSEGTLGGKFTTIEGLIKDCIDQLSDSNPFIFGDSTDSNYSGKMKEFLNKLEKIRKGELLNVTIILDDPSGNSYLQNIYAPENDPNLEESHYERSYEQNEELGLNDINTDHYQNSN